MYRTYKEDNSLQIKWKKKEHYFDVLPFIFFEKPCKNKSVEHTMFWDNQDRAIEKVKCKLTVNNSQAILNYIDMNDPKLGLDEGKLTIYFTGDSRSIVKQIDWEDATGNVEKILLIQTGTHLTMSKKGKYI